MLGNEPGVDALHQVSQPDEVPLVEPVGAAERKSDTMQRNRVVASGRVENHERLTAAHVVLGVHFKPGRRRSFVQHGPVMREAQPEGGGERGGYERTIHRWSPKRWLRTACIRPPDPHLPYSEATCKDCGASRV